MCAQLSSSRYFGGKKEHLSDLRCVLYHAIKPSAGRGVSFHGIKPSVGWGVSYKPTSLTRFSAQIFSVGNWTIYTRGPSPTVRKPELENPKRVTYTKNVNSKLDRLHMKSQMARVSGLVLLIAIVFVHVGRADYGNMDGVVYCSDPKQDAPCNSKVDAPCCRDGTTMAYCNSEFFVGGHWDIIDCQYSGETCQSWYSDRGKWLGTYCDDDSGDGYTTPNGDSVGK
jgi:hypothetical protein